MHKYFVSYRGTYDVTDNIRDTFEERDTFSSDIIVVPYEITDEKSLENVESVIENRWGLNSITILFFKELFDK